MSKVLVVDDDDAIVSTVSAILKRAGHEVHIAKDGLAAVEKVFANRDFSAVLMDMVMPRMGGGEALRAIWRLMPKARYIVITGMSSEDEVKEEVDPYIKYQYVSKPFNCQDLVQFLEPLN